jgi:hypothetical protein
MFPFSSRKWVIVEIYIDEFGFVLLAEYRGSRNLGIVKVE